MAGFMRKAKFAVSLLLFSLSLSACDKVQECVTAIDNSNEAAKVEFDIAAHNSQPLMVPAGDNYSYEATGEVMMGCESSEIFIAPCSDPANNCVDEPGKFYMTNGDWKNVNVPLKDEDVLVVNSISGSWSVRESQGQRECLLAAGVGDENKCLAEQGRGLFIEMQSGDPFELTGAAQGGGQAIAASDLQGAGGGGKQLRLRFSHKKHATTDETTPADPSNTKYMYEPGGYRLAMNFCRSAVNSFKDGDCLQSMKTKDGVAFFFDDHAGGACKGDGNYGNNYGTYHVTLTNGAGNNTSSFDNFLSSIVVAYKAFLFGKGNDGEGGVVSALYKGLTSQQAFMNLMRGAMALSIAFIGVGYVGGMVRMNWESFVKLVFKYAVVIALISPNGWKIVYMHIGINFTEGVDGMLMGIAQIFQEMVTGAQVPTVNVAASEHLHDYATAVMGEIKNLGNAEQWKTIFEVANLPLSLMGSRNVWIKLSALLLSFPLGTFYFFVIIVGIVMYFFTLAKIVFNYLVTLTLAALMLNLLPIAALFWMFGKTKFVFESVLNHLFTCFLQILFTMTFLMFFSIVIYCVMYAMMMFTVCLGCALMIDFGLSEFLLNVFGDFDIVCLIYGYLPWGAGIINDVWYRIGNFPVPFFRVGAFIIVIYMFQHTVDWIMDLCRRFGDSFSPAIGMNKIYREMQANVIKQPLALPRNALSLGKHSVVETAKTARTGIKASGDVFKAMKED